jgi:trehalose 6-phosphate phosphatase
MIGSQDAINKINRAEGLRLFLDYDGTLADFAPTPDEIYPDPQVIDILTGLKKNPHIQPAVLSGRRLDHVIRLTPVDGILLAGTYGIEMRLPDGERLERLDYSAIRPALDNLKPLWDDLISCCKGFYLEDKGWTLAIHAKHADDRNSENVLPKARQTAVRRIDKEVFRILGGDKFLEVGPKLANKGKAIEYLLTRYPLDGALPLYIGDDDKDEEAFEVINRNGGVAVLVSETDRETHAALRLENPSSVREWLKLLVKNTNN